ncbi:hypothetical protein TCAL_14992 [Tigriopus californicus]|uniref:Uncharacterized protein n=1 Tax=Tigriopus californicus TaxID=6832 RepID=A0A553N7L6_TIGCA|nr:hypothetical protein TCAL_14992 [Tigriopus californicus]
MPRPTHTPALQNPGRARTPAPGVATGGGVTGWSQRAYDDLMRCGSVFHSGAEREFWSERDNELTAKDYKIQQARKMVEDERRGRLAPNRSRCLCPTGKAGPLSIGRAISPGGGVIHALISMASMDPAPSGGGGQ